MSEDIRNVRQRVTQELHQNEQREQVSALAVHGDPSAKRPDPAIPASGRSAGLQWVRASDVLRGQGHRLADLHASGQESVVKHMRHGMSQIATSRRGVARQAVSLPPVGSFGQQTVRQTEALGR